MHSEEMAKEAVLQALIDAGIHYADIKQACVGSVSGRCKIKKIFFFCNIKIQIAFK